MTSLPTSTRSLRQRNTHWVSFSLLLSPILSLVSLTVSGVLLLRSLHPSPSVAITTTPASLTPNTVISANTDTELVHNTSDTATAHQSDFLDIQLATPEFYQLITLSILEAPTLKGRLDVIQSVFNRINAHQVDLGHYGNNVTEVVFAEGQYEPYFGLSPTAIVDFDSAVILLTNHGYTHSHAETALEAVITALQTPHQVIDARTHVGGRTSFKGTTQYTYRVPAEDPLRVSGENFFHIDDSQTYQQLTRLEQLGPQTVKLIK